MNDFEHGQAQALANVDAILLDTMRPLIGVDLATYRMLAALRRRIKTLVPPATSMRIIGTAIEIELDPDVMESL